MNAGNRKVVVVAVATALSLIVREGNAYGLKIDGGLNKIGETSYITGSMPSDTEGGMCSITIGKYTASPGFAATSMGLSTTAVGDYSTAIGNLSQAIGEGSFAGGTGYVEGSRWFPVSHYAGTAYGKDSFAFGTEAVAGAMSGTGTTEDPYVYTGDHSIAMGYGALASAESSVALGAHSEARGANSLAFIGGVASEVNAIAIGSNAKAMAENSVAIGTGSVATASNEVSVGSTSQTRRITNVADGEATHDAVTVGQLSNAYSEIAATNLVVTANTQAIGAEAQTRNNADVWLSGRIDVANNDISVLQASVGHVAGQGEAATGLFEAINDETASRESVDNALASEIANNRTDISNNATAIQQNQANILANRTDITTLNSELVNTNSIVTQNAADIVLNTSKIEANTANIAVNAAAIVSETNARMAQDTALNNEILKTNAVVTTNAANIATNAADIATNKTAIATNATNIVTNATNIHVNRGYIAINAMNVAANTTAINTHVDDTVRHITAEERSYWNAKTDKSYVDAAISNQDKRMEKKVNRLGAKSAALSALHPMDFDEEHKVSASAGVGTYGGENAAAVGVFYRPTENLMFNLGGAAGRGSVMGNLGVSYRFGGGGSSVGSLTASQMAMQLNALRDTNRSVEAQLKASLLREEASEKRAKVSRTEVAQLKKRAEVAALRIERLEKQNAQFLRDFVELKSLVQQMAKAKSR